MAKPRRVHQDGIHFQCLRYLDTTLAAYVGEDVTIRYDPRDMAEIRVFHHDQFVCRAVCQDIADQTVSLKEVIQARAERRRQLRADVQTRMSVVDRLVAVHHPAAHSLASDSEASTPPATPRLKRYKND